MLREAELDFLNSDYTDTNALLTWLCGVTPSSSAAAPSDNPTEWVQLNARAQTLLSFLQAGLDYYGQPRDHAPLTSLGYYQSQSTTLLVIADAINQAYIKYQSDASQQQDAVAQLQATVSQVSNHIGALQQDLTAAQAEQTSTQNAAATLFQAMQAQLSVVNAAQTAVQVALANIAPPNCTFTEVLTCMTTLLFLSADAYTAMTGIGDVLEGLSTESTSAGDIMKLIEPVGDYSIPNLQTQWGNISQYLTPSTPDYAKIIGQSTDWQSTLTTFDTNIQSLITANPSVSSEATNFQTQVHTYVDIIQAHNQKIFDYTALVLKANHLQALINHKQTEYNRVSNAAADAVNPTTVEFLTFMQGAYQDVMGQLARYVFNENAAFNYWSLQTNPLTIADQSVGELATSFGTIMQSVGNLLDTTDTPRQPFNGITFTFDAGDYPAQFQSFQQGVANGSDVSHSLTISIPVNSPSFAGWYQIIAQSFTISVTGATTTSGDLDVDLKHSGRALFLDKTGATVEFSHEPTVQDYKYNIAGGTSVGGGALGGDANNLNIIGVSPCTTWTVEVVASNNPGLVMSNVSQVAITFSGLYFPNAVNVSRG